jgi:long-chain acyl-CoA synthetase
MTDAAAYRPWTKHYEQGVPAEPVFREQTVVEFLDASAVKWAQRPAVTFKGRTLTYAELQDQVDRFAAGLAGLGVGRDSRVALWLPNLPQMVIAYFATLRLGAQVVNTNPLYVERELEYQFNDAGVSVVVTLDYLWEGKLRGILAKTGVKHVVVTSIPEYLPFPLSVLAPLKLKKTGQYVRVKPEPGVHFFRDLVKQNAPIAHGPYPRLDDVALLQYTGGTTGVSKGAMLTHRNISVNAQQCGMWFHEAVDGKEVTIACLPFFHVFGMTVAMLWPVMAGFQIVLAPNPRDIDDLVASIRRYRVSMFPAVPALYIAINNYPNIEKLDITSIKGCFSGSAPLPVEVLNRFESLTGGRITEGFGMTETSPVTHGNPLNGVRKPGTVGVPMPGTDHKVVDIETGTRELGPGEEGELCLRGPQVMLGYWNRPEDTAQTLRDGWVYSGDLARIDEDGYCAIVGRKKDMIIVNGCNVYPDEVDGVLLSHPSVLEAATIGVPDAQRGEVVRSYVVVRPGMSVSADELRDHCRKLMSAYKVPRHFDIVTDLPKSSMMKVLRTELRSRAVNEKGS